MPDFFDVSRHFTAEERAVQSSVRAFVDARVLPIIGDHFEKGTFPTELIPRDRRARPARLQPARIRLRRV